MAERLLRRFSAVKPPTGVRRALAGLCALIGMLCGLMASTEPVAAQERVVREEELVRCIGPDTYVDVEDAKEKLLATVKRAAVTNFYGEYISAETTVTDSVLTRDEVNVAVQGLVRIEDDLNYYNSTEDLGQICVRARAYVTEGDLQLFDLQPARAERRCDSGEGTPEERRQEVQDRLRNAALVAYDGRLGDVDEGRRLALLREVEFVEAGFQPDTGAYCASLESRVMPFEVYALLGVAPPPPKLVPTPLPVTPLRILGVTPAGVLEVGELLTVRGSAPPETQVEVLASGAPLGVTTSAADGAWQVEIPFNTAGTYRLTTRMYLADGTVRPGSRDVLIRVVVPTPTHTPTATATPSATPTHTSTATATPSATSMPASPIVEVVSERLNVRAGPGTGYAILQNVSRGARLSVTGKIENCAWLQVSLNGGQAWVSGDSRYTRLSVACQSVALKPAPSLPVAPSGTDRAEEILIPAGEFVMGSPDGDDDERPQHTVYLDDYYIDKYEVTNARYKVCVDAGRCTAPGDVNSWTRSPYYGTGTYADYPVISVTWHQARAFCAWAGKRLPTEAEWEKAARGTDGRTYPWGNEAPNCGRANYNFSCVGDTSEVGAYPSGASPYGVMDMAGNVFEWVNDWYDGSYYSVSPSANPQGPATGEYRVLRGGSWGGNGVSVRSADRVNLVPGVWSGDVGFRCVRSQ